MTKVTAKGLVGGKTTVVTCVGKGGVVEVFKDGKKLKGYDSLSFELSSRAFLRYLNAAPCSYNPEPDTIEAYWLVLLEEYFDEAPEITVDGELDTFGSPYSNEDTDNVVF